MKRFLVLSVFSFQLSSAGENPTYDFLRNDVSARSAAMAGSFVSMTNDVNAIFSNPAGTATISQAQASFGFTRYLLDINSGYVSYAQELPGIGFVSGGINYYNYGTFDRTDDLANKLGTFGAGDLSAAIGYASEVSGNILVGAAGKFVYSSIADVHSTGLAADLGVLYLIPGANPLALGASILNLGGQLTPYYTTKESLPLDIKVGATIKPEHLPLLLNVNFHKINEEQKELIQHLRAFSVGGEFTLSKELRFRFGFHNERRKELKIGSSAGLAGFSFGAGLVLETLRFDYAYNSLGKIGSINRVTVGIDL